MSVVLNVPEFNMYIRSPLSTSIHLEVALRFSGESGMVLELNNSNGQSKDLRAMDVSWISRYREEEERYVKLCVPSLQFTLSCCPYSVYSLDVFMTVIADYTRDGQININQLMYHRFDLLRQQ